MTDPLFGFDMLYFDRETPAPITPGSFSSPTLKRRLMDMDRIPIMITVKPAKSQNGTLMSCLVQAAPPQCVTLPFSLFVAWQ